MTKERGREWEEYDNAVRWMATTFIIALVTTIVLAYLAQPLTFLIQKGLSKENTDIAIRFLKKSFSDPGFLYDRYIKWFKQVIRYHGEFRLSLWLPILPIISFPLILAIGGIKCPYKFQSNVHGSAHIATLRDIENMPLLGFDGFCMVVGRFQGKLLKLKETLSTLCCAPPGTGKTAGVVIPTIFNSEGLSIIVNDPKPELCYSTTGARNKVGPVFVINWGKEDNPETGEYYPSWNPLSPGALPAPGPERDLYIDSMCNTLVEDPKGGGDAYWSQSGRSALCGLIHFVASKCEKALANERYIQKIYEGTLTAKDKEELIEHYTEMQGGNLRNNAARAIADIQSDSLTIENYLPIGTWNSFPEKWINHEPCMAMILEWITTAQIEQSNEIKRRMDEGDQMAAMADLMGDLLDAAVNEANDYGYSRRCVTELSGLRAKPDKERGSVLSTAFNGIRIFKNAAVVARTSFSDLKFKDLRGMKDPVTGEWKPISVYLSVNQTDAQALNPISAVFVDLMSAYLISNPPNSVNKTDGKMGPFPTLFVLDEFPQMPKLKAVIDGPAVGRGQKVSYLLIGQDLGQISGKYGKDDLETVISTTACKVILSQNNEQTAQRFSKMIGNKTVQTTSYSRNEGGISNKDFNPFSKNVSYQLQGVSAISTNELLSLPMLKQVVLMQGAIETPIMADAPRWYLDKKMKAQAALPAAPNVPDWIVAQRTDENEDILSKLGIDYDPNAEEESEFEEDEA